MFTWLTLTCVLGWSQETRWALKQSSICSLCPALRANWCMLTLLKESPCFPQPPVSPSDPLASQRCTSSLYRTPGLGHSLYDLNCSLSSANICQYNFPFRLTSLLGHRFQPDLFSPISTRFCVDLIALVVQESFCQFPEEIIFSEDCSTYRCIFDVLDGWWVSHSPILPLWLDSLEPDFIYCACRGWVFDLQMNHWSCNYCMGMEVWTSAGRGYGARMEIFALKWKSWSTFPFLKKMKNSNSFHLSWGGPMSFLLT